MTALTASKLSYDPTIKPNPLFSPYVLVDGRHFHNHQLHPVHLNINVKEIPNTQEEGQEDIYAQFRVGYDEGEDDNEEEDGYFCSQNEQMVEKQSKRNRTSLGFS